MLRTVCDPVVDIDEGVRALVQDLLDTVDMEGRAGLASTQIGHTLRVFSLHIDGQLSYVINPQIAALEGTPVLTGEGCLSVPDLWFDVERYPRATVRGIDLDGNPVEITGEGLLAQALQHECDHLDGKLYLSRLDRETRGEAMRQIRTSSWF